jgi:hypothetical protein
MRNNRFKNRIYVLIQVRPNGPRVITWSTELFDIARELLTLRQIALEARPLCDPQFRIQPVTRLIGSGRMLADNLQS